MESTTQITRLVIPERFWNVRYNGKAIPDGFNDLSSGANCQRFAYALLAFYGRKLPPFRSSELWEDNTFTFPPTHLEPLDLLLFNENPQAFGAHVAVYLGEGDAIRSWVDTRNISSRPKILHSRNHFPAYSQIERL